MSNLRIQKEKELQEVKAVFENRMYEMWKQNNGKFMKRYIKELISDGDLSFSFDSSYSGYFQMEVSMDEKVLTTVDGEICMSRDSLEE